jgi:hypothetical protein
VPLQRYQGKTLAVVWANLSPLLEGILRSLYKSNDQVVSHPCLFDVSTWREKRTASLLQSIGVLAEDGLPLAGECTAKSGDFLFDLMLKSV